MSDRILSLDQGTTSSRAILFDRDGVVTEAQEEFAQHYPRSGWVEHEPDDIWRTVVSTARSAIEAAGGPGDIAGIGITNQRETVLIWDRESGKPIHRAIVWQDRRTAAFCDRLRSEGHEGLFTERTGLLIDPYFSGTKISWLLENVEGARDKARDGRLAFGTIDSYLVWRLTGGRVHVTDATNAARTLIYNIETNDWDDDLLRLLDIPRALLPEVRDCASEFGTSDPEIFGVALPIRGIAGDQQAATVGQACFSPGMLKSTYGTGCFALLNTGPSRVTSKNRLLTTIAYRLDGHTTYALEGSIFIAGAAVQWLRDGLGVLDDAAHSGKLAEAADEAQDVILVPAFTGLGAPYWEPRARGAMFGLTRGSGPAEFARAALESVCFQTRDLWEAMRSDWRTEGEAVLRVDGGMTASDWTMQRLSDILGVPVDRPKIQETTALGAAWLAGRQAGVWPDEEGFAAQWVRDRRFEPAMGEDARERSYRRWRAAVDATLAYTAQSPS